MKLCNEDGYAGKFSDNAYILQDLSPKEQFELPFPHSFTSRMNNETHTKSVYGTYNNISFSTTIREP